MLCEKRKLESGRIPTGGSGTIYKEMAVLMPSSAGRISARP